MRKFPVPTTHERNLHCDYMMCVEMLKNTNNKTKKTQSNLMLRGEFISLF